MKVELNLSENDVYALKYYELKPYHTKAQRAVSKVVSKILRELEKQIEKNYKG